MDLIKHCFESHPFILIDIEDVVSEKIENGVKAYIHRRPYQEFFHSIENVNKSVLVEIIQIRITKKIYDSEINKEVAVKF